MHRLEETFYHRPCLEVAHDLIGKVIVHRVGEQELRLRITQTEAYCGEADTACHAHKGKTARTRVMYERAGMIYVYLCYGMHWMLNVVTGEEGFPEAVLIRACAGADGPGKLTKFLKITGELNEKNLCTDAELWIADDGFSCGYTAAPRVGISYASPEDQARLWRFILQENKE